MSLLATWMGAILGMFLTLPTGPLLPGAAAYPAGSVTDAPSVRQPGAAVVADQPCTVGWGDPDTGFARSILSSVVSAGSQAWAVGLTTESEDPRYPLAVHWDGSAWKEMPIASSTNERALFGMDRSPSGRMWAVGYRTRSTPYYPMLMRWNGSQWVVSSMGPISSRAGALLSVRARSDSLTWAVGYKIGKAGQRPMAVRRVGTKWRDDSPHAPATATGVLMDIDARTSADAWAVGWLANRGAPQPYLAHWNGGRWVTGKPVLSGSEGALTAVAMVSAHNVWAVGYRVVGGVYRPTVQRWNGRSWRLVPFPSVPSGVAVLRDVQIGSDGQPVVVGTRWDSKTGTWRGMSARRQGATWYVMDTPEIGTGTELRDLATRADGTAIVVGASGAHSLAMSLCPEPQASTTGVAAGPTAPDPGPTVSEPAASPSPEPSAAPSPELSSAPAPAPSASHQAAPKRTRAPRVTATPRPPVIVRDMTKAAGLTKSTSSYGAVRADFNADGWPDLFIGRHSNPGWLAYNAQDGTFVDAPGVSIERRDRHGCAAGDADGDGRLDLYCVNGAFHGAGLKRNELYIQQPDGSFVDKSMALRATDPFGRGRLVAMFDLDHDQYADLFLANRPARTDGFPSVDRVLSNPGGNGYVGQSVSGFDASSGADCLRPADLDRDGWTDILLCERAMDRPGTYGLHILRNVRGRLVDVTARFGIVKRQAVDAIAVDVNGDHQLDIVEVDPFDLRIYLRRGGHYILGYSRALKDGVAVAAGDIDGDGDKDLYVVQGSRSRQRPDLMLRNRGDGRGFSPMAVPRAANGSAESVTAIDYDRNGLMDFLVLNGKGALYPGPVQLLAFFPRK